MSGFRSGIAAIVGRPNVGKSTLVNALVGQKVAIVSDKPQTTRSDIRGILTTADAQVVFTDTPGFHKPHGPLGHRLNDLVGDAVQGVDVVVLVVDAKAGVGRGDAFVFERQVSNTEGARFCVVNKIDALDHHAVVPELAAASRLGDFDEIVPLSSRTTEGVEELRDLILARLPEGPPLYPAEQVSDQPLEVHLAELVREQALAVTREEVPHSVAVVVDEIEREGDLTRVSAAIVVERDSQKGILIGRGGETLKTIGSKARAQIEPFVGTKVFLDLRVKVMKEWQKDTKALNRLGL
jgi:GTP-binding protein Era